MRQQFNVTLPRGDQPQEQGMYNTAISFHEAAIRCAAPVEIEEGGTTSPTSPMIACYAFAAELYLKSLVVLDTGGVIPGHRLNVLFNRLRAETQKSIAERYRNLLNATETDLREALSDLGAAFVDWRYIYESDPGRHIDVRALVHFVQSLFAEIRARRPGWPVTEHLQARLIEPPAQDILFVVSGGGGVMVRVLSDPNAKL
jgi:hypothetical protein